jgi:hypothetical protein
LAQRLLRVCFEDVPTKLHGGTTTPGASTASNTGLRETKGVLAISLVNAMLRAGLSKRG